MLDIDTKDEGNENMQEQVTQKSKPDDVAGISLSGHILIHQNF